VLPVLRRGLDAASRAPLTRQVGIRFGVFTVAVFLPLQVVTGVALATHRGVTVEELGQAGYGRTLSGKLSLFVVVLLLSGAQSAGASGAVFGLMGGAIVLFRSRGFSLMESGLGLWLGLNLLITFTIPNISIGGHLGGLAGGLLATFVLVELGEHGRVSMPVAESLCAAIGVAAVAASIAGYG